MSADYKQRPGIDLDLPTGKPSNAPSPKDVREIMDARGERTDGRFVRSYEESLDPTAYAEAAEEQFPPVRADAEHVERRDFFKIAGAGMALAGLTACTKQPLETIVPYGNQPEDMVPGKPLFYATAYTQRGIAYPVVAESHMGRPTKIEGNEKAGHRATSHFAQASLLNLYDPDRSRSIKGESRDKQELIGRVLKSEIESWQVGFMDTTGKWFKGDNIGGAGVAILMGPHSSPTLGSVIDGLLAKNKEIKVYTHDSLGGDERTAACNAAADGNVPVYHFDKASVVLDLGADSLNPAISGVANAAGWATGRNFVDNFDALLGGAMNRLYAVETDFTVTGAAADHRLPATPSQINAFARQVAAELGVAVKEAAAAEVKPAVEALEAAGEGEKEENITEIDASQGADNVKRREAVGGAGAAVAALEESDFAASFLNALVADLKAAGSGALVVAGENLPASTQALALKLNEVLGGLGNTVTFAPSPFVEPKSGTGTLAELATALDGDEVRALFVLDCNPVYTAPAELAFAEKLEKAGTVYHLGAYVDETAEVADWHIPLAHFLESWGDARTVDGTACLVQPLIQPLYEGAMSVLDLALVLAGKSATAHETLKKFWTKGEGLSENDWVTALHSGFVEGSAPAPASVSSIAFEDEGIPASSGEGIEVNFTLDPSVLDGSFANNVWLQEMPTPLTTLTWDNVITVSPNTADQFKLDMDEGQSGREADEFQRRHTLRAKVELVKLTVNGMSVIGPVRIAPGHADGCATVTFGYGRDLVSMPNASGIGYNANAIRGASGFAASGASIEGTGDHYKIAMTQDHHRIKDGNPKLGYRALAKHGTLNQLKAEQQEHAFGHGLVQGNQHRFPQDLTMYRRKDDKRKHQIYVNDRLNKVGTQWGMCIDMTRCIGCNACVIACHAENNTTTVGKQQIMNGREMHWIRVDRYYDAPDGEFAAPEKVSIHTQPVTCMHCEEAGCEVVCPVGATVHSNDGLNQMVYNRCIGTRYCSNNCPYKVRRFNFLQWSDRETETRKMGRNPNVTVRVRGVMEKCTYCIQRINKARIEAKVDADNPYNKTRSMAEGSVITACQQACPTKAIAFGNICDDDAEVSKYKATEALDYALLGEVNMRPRTTYLARIRNKTSDIDPTDAVDLHVEELKKIKSHGKHHGGHGDDHGDHGDHDGGHKNGHADGHAADKDSHEDGTTHGDDKQEEAK